MAEPPSSLPTGTFLLVLYSIGHCSLVSVLCRLSTVHHADSIIVMEGGTIMEVGSHDQLLEQRGVYYTLVNAQVRPHY